MAGPYAFGGAFDGLQQVQPYGYPPFDQQWPPDDVPYARGYPQQAAPYHQMDRFAGFHDQQPGYPPQRMHSPAGFADPMQARHRLGPARGMRGLPVPAGYQDFDAFGAAAAAAAAAGYYPDVQAKLEPVDTLHVSTPHDRSLDRADLCDIFFAMPAMKKISFHENYVFVLFDSVAAARNAMLALQQGQAGPKATLLTVTFARQSYRDNYYHPDEVYLPSKRLHLTHFPKNTQARELERIFSRYRGFERLEHNIKWAYVDFVHENFAKEAMEELNTHTNLIVSYAKPGAGDMRAQQSRAEAVWAMQYAARLRGLGFDGDGYKRAAPPRMPTLEELRASPAGVAELGQILHQLSLADAAKRGGSPAFDVLARPRTASSSPGLLPAERHPSGPLLAAKDLQIEDGGGDYRITMEPRPAHAVDRSVSVSPLSMREAPAIMQTSATPVAKHGIIRRPTGDGEQKDSWSGLSTPGASPTTSPPLARDSAFASSAETLLYPAESPYSSPTLSSVSDEIRERQRAKDAAHSDGESGWSFFKHGMDIARSRGGSDSEDDLDSEKTTAETA